MATQPKKLILVAALLLAIDCQAEAPKANPPLTTEQRKLVAERIADFNAGRAAACEADKEQVTRDLMEANRRLFVLRERYVPLGPTT